MKVLRLVAAGLSNQEMSERLFLALGTVKGHTHKIFGKLGAQRRTEAIARARELGCSKPIGYRLTRMERFGLAMRSVSFAPPGVFVPRTHPQTELW